MNSAMAAMAAIDLFTFLSQCPAWAMIVVMQAVCHEQRSIRIIDGPLLMRNDRCGGLVYDHGMMFLPTPNE